MISSRDETRLYAGYATGPGYTIELYCRAPGEASNVLFGTATASSNPLTWAGTTIYYWSTQASVPEQCWTESGPGTSAANVHAWEVESQYTAFRITDVGCAYALASPWGIPNCSGFPSWARLEAPSDVTPGADPLAGMGSPTVVASGLSFAEGPIWQTGSNRLLFTDIETDTIWSVPDGGTPSVLESGSGTHTNGQAFNPGGRIVRMEHATQRVTLAGSSPRVLADTYNGQALNSPNDAAVSPYGTIYFTDPTYGANPAWGGATPVLGFRGLYRIDWDGELTLEHSWTDRQPNGVVLSPQGDTLYVADTQQGEVLQMPVNADGSLGATSFFATVPGADGMTIDIDGNVYVTGSPGVSVFAPDGSTWGTIPFTQATNCTFGGEDRSTLYVTTRPTVYAVDLAIKGAPSAS